MVAIRKCKQALELLTFRIFLAMSMTLTAFTQMFNVNIKGILIKYYYNIFINILIMSNYYELLL